MCEPTSIVMGIAAIAGAGITAYSQREQGKFQEAVAKQNADLDLQSRDDAIRRGAIAEEQHRAKVRQILGTQRAIMGANNVVSSTGTPLGLLAESAQMGEEDAVRLRTNAMREAYGFGVQASSSRTRAQMYRRGGNQAAGATVLAGAANAYGMWKKAG